MTYLSTEKGDLVAVTGDVMNDQNRQPSHLALSREIAALGATMLARFEGVEKQMATEFKNIENRMNARDVELRSMAKSLGDIDKRTAVLESHEDAPAAPAKPVSPHWALLAAAGVAVFGGLASAATTIESILHALWHAIKGGAV